MESRANKAVHTFANGFNCAQAVLTSYSDEYGIPDEIAKKIACGFGGGMGYSNEACGAVSGAVMLISLKHGKYIESDKESKEKTYKLVKKFTDSFREEFGAVSCHDLLKFDLSKEDEMQKARESGIFKELCPRLVRRSVELVEEILK